MLYAIHSKTIMSTQSGHNVPNAVIFIKCKTYLTLKSAIWQLWYISKCNFRYSAKLERNLN